MTLYIEVRRLKTLTYQNEQFELKKRLSWKIVKKYEFVKNIPFSDFLSSFPKSLFCAKNELKNFVKLVLQILKDFFQKERTEGFNTLL